MGSGAYNCSRVAVSFLADWKNVLKKVAVETS